MRRLQNIHRAQEGEAEFSEEENQKRRCRKAKSKAKIKYIEPNYLGYEERMLTEMEPKFGAPESDLKLIEM